MQRDVSRDINAVGDRLSAKADTPEQKAVLATDMAKFKSDYLGKYQGVMAARGRTASSMVTGPAKFPTARNQKALDAEQKKATDFNDWRNRAIKAMEKRLQDARTSDQIDREAMVKLIKAVDDAMNTVQQIDADDPRWRGFDRSAFTRSISGVLKRLGDFGKTNQINAALAHITERQAGWAKPFFAPNNSVWKLATEDGGTPEVPSSLSETPPFLFKSETIRSTDRRGNLTEVYVNPGAGTLTNLLKERDGHVRFLVGGDNIAVARARDMTHPQIAYSLADAAHPMVDDVRREGGGRWFVRRESAPGPGRYPFGNMNISVGNGRGDLPVEQWPAGLRRAVGGLGLEDGLAESPTPLYSIARDAALRDVASITRADIRDAADRIVSEVEAAGFVLTKVNRSGLSDSTYLRFERPDGQAIDATKSGRRRYWTETGGSFPSIMSGGFNVRISDHNAVGGPTEVHSGVRVGPTQDAGIYATAKKARLLAEVQRKPMGQIGGELAESPTPLYSAVSRAVDNLKQTKGTGEQFLSMISKTPGVKPEEVKWLGLDDWLKGQKSVTKEAIQDYVRAHALDVREVTKGATADDGPDEGRDPDMDAYLASRGKPQPVHSFDLTPELLHAATTEGMALFERKAPLPPRTGPDLFGGNRAEPTARTPEPTIRNDQRQVDMFGRNDAAIQAQAARDAAGPRSNQQPANEGLFARPETPQPALPMARVSRWLSGGGENFVDHLASAPTRGHASAADWVMLRGGNTGHEYIAVVDNQTGEIVHAGTNGKPRSVGFEGTNTLNDNDAYTIHHNHPRGTALSDTDLTMLANPGISHVVAHGHGGEVSIASLGPKWALRGAAKNAENAIANTRELRHVVFAADSRARGVLQGMINRGELSIDDGNLHFHDFRNRLLNAIGTINYVSSHRLPASLMAAFRAELNKMGVKPDATGSYDRFTVAIRPEERVAGLPGGVDTRPAQGPARGQGGGRAGPAVSPRQPQARLLEGDVTDTPAFRRWFGASKVVAAFSPTQIKSAIGNRGTFDPASPNILEEAAD